MKSFNGFPEKAEVTPLPNLFFTVVMPQMQDIVEIKTALHIFWLLSRRQGYPRFVTYSELITDPVLASSIGGKVESRQEKLRRALDLAIQDGILLNLKLDKDGKPDDAYFINAAAEKRALNKVKQDEIYPTGLLPKRDGESPLPPPDIFTLYEQNIGMLTPMIAEELKEAEKTYPVDWIESAFREAVSLNKRSWKYIARILERWKIEGKDDGKFRRDFKEKREPSKYTGGRYGHMVKR
jgi:DnaD/phage-associated family protein